MACKWRIAREVGHKVCRSAQRDVLAVQKEKGRQKAALLLVAAYEAIDVLRVMFVAQRPSVCLVLGGLVAELARLAAQTRLSLTFRTHRVTRVELVVDAFEIRLARFAPAYATLNFLGFVRLGLVV